MTHEQYQAAIGPDGAMLVGNPDYVAKKLIVLIETLGLNRFMLHLPIGSMPHEDILKAIEFFGTQADQRSENTSEIKNEHLSLHKSAVL